MSARMILLLQLLYRFKVAINCPTLVHMIRCIKDWYIIQWTLVFFPFMHMWWHHDDIIRFLVNLTFLIILLLKRKEKSNGYAWASHAEIKQHTHTHKALTGHVDAKNLISQRRQSDCMGVTAKGTFLYLTSPFNLVHDIWRRYSMQIYIVYWNIM